MVQLNVFRYAKIQAIVMGFVGLVLGVLYSFGGALIDLFVTLGLITTQETPGLSYGTVLAFLALPLMPLYLAVFGFISGVIGTVVFNLFSKWINIDLKIEK